MENSSQVNFILSDEYMTKFNEIVSEQLDAQVVFNPTTEKVIKTGEEWHINFN